MTNKVIKNTRISFRVAPYALFDVLKALQNDCENYTELSVGMEDSHLVVFVTKRPKKVEADAEGEVPVAPPEAL